MHPRVLGPALMESDCFPYEKGVWTQSQTDRRPCDDKARLELHSCRPGMGTLEGPGAGMGQEVFAQSLSVGMALRTP